MSFLDWFLPLPFMLTFWGCFLDRVRNTLDVTETTCPGEGMIWARYTYFV